MKIADKILDKVPLNINQEFLLINNIDFVFTDVIIDDICDRCIVMDNYK